MVILLLFRTGERDNPIFSAEKGHGLKRSMESANLQIFKKTDRPIWIKRINIIETF